MTRTPVTVRVARWSATHPWRSLGLWLGLVAVSVVLSATVAPKTATSEDMAAGSSQQALRLLDDAGLEDPASELVVVSSPDGELDRPDAVAALADGAARMDALPEVAAVGDVVWAADGAAALLPVHVRGDPEEASDHIGPLHEVTAAVARDHPGLRVEQTGGASVDAAVTEVVEEDLASAEALSLPVTLGLMLLAFGALIAAAVPVLLALTSVGIALGLYAVVSQMVPDMGTVANMVLLIGMAVGVDYSLFFVKRQREERQRGLGPIDAVEVAAATAGHSILVAGVAVIVSVSALLLVGSVIFSGLAVGAILVVAVAMLGSLTVVPALVGKLGRWVDRPRIPLLWRLAARTRSGAFSGRIVGPVLRRPVVALAVSGTILVALAAPALTLRLEDTDLSQLPDGIAEVEALERVQTDFPTEGDEVVVVAHVASGTTAPAEDALASLRAEAEASGRFAPGASVATSEDGRTFELVLPTPDTAGAESSAAALDLVRSDLGPALLDDLDGVRWETAGAEAESRDSTDQQASALPWVVGAVLLFTLAVMGVTFRSGGVALLTLLLNVASVAVAFGVLALVFQHGWAEGLLDFESNGTVVTWIPMFLFVVLVGLSMDYHVLVLSRIREAAHLGASPRDAVATGIRQTAGPVSMAALVMVSVFGLFATASMVEMKQMGVGLAVAILVDATLVRIVVLPALLALRPGIVSTMARRSSGRHQAPLPDRAPESPRPPAVPVPVPVTAPR
ncbi:MAG TPA: MMPL family transporter [Acidimicrobiales bacterium]|nr:MMPL family transporter [Acidimicrobiales bacterium]